jgi:hypothetical protein
MEEFIDSPYVVRRLRDVLKARQATNRAGPQPVSYPSVVN